MWKDFEYPVIKKHRVVRNDVMRKLEGTMYALVLYKKDKYGFGIWHVDLVHGDKFIVRIATVNTKEEALEVSTKFTHTYSNYNELKKQLPTLTQNYENCKR